MNTDHVKTYAVLPTRIDVVAADQAIAKEFHDIYERLAPSFGYETRQDTREFDPDSNNGRLMTAVCSTVCSSVALEAFKAGFERGKAERNDSR